jgi:hypothetical protein
MFGLMVNMTNQKPSEGGERQENFRKTLKMIEDALGY